MSLPMKWYSSTSESGAQAASKSSPRSAHRRAWLAM